MSVVGSGSAESAESEYNICKMRTEMEYENKEAKKFVQWFLLCSVIIPFLHSIRKPRNCDHRCGKNDRNWRLGRG